MEFREEEEGTTASGTTTQPLPVSDSDPVFRRPCGGGGYCSFGPAKASLFTSTSSGKSR